jgi:hypothetical protein
MPKKTPNVNYSFILNHPDEENARGMFEYLLNERPLDRGCCQVIERGASPCNCKCLTRIAQVICKDVIREAEGDDFLFFDQAAKLVKWEQWKETLIFFARLLRVVAVNFPDIVSRDPDNIFYFVKPVSTWGQLFIEAAERHQRKNQNSNYSLYKIKYIKSSQNYFRN